MVILLLADRALLLEFPRAGHAAEHVSARDDHAVDLLFEAEFALVLLRPAQLLQLDFCLLDGLLLE